MKKFSIILIIIYSTGLYAIDGGKVGFSFLKIGVNGRAAGMGEAYTAVAKDASATYWNPAGLAMAKSNSAILTHNVWLQDIKHNFAAVQITNGTHNIAFSLNMISVPGIEIRDDTPTEKPIGTTTAQNLYLGMAYATNIGNQWTLGAQLKYFYEKYYLYESNGIAFDFGVQKHELIKSLDWGFTIQNLGKMKKLKNEHTELPITFRSGFGYKLPWKVGDDNILAAADIVYVLNDAFRINMGGEISFLNMLSLRMGYVLGSDSYNFTAGFGLLFNRYRISYAFVPFKYDLGNSHRFSINIYFN